MDYGIRWVSVGGDKRHPVLVFLHDALGSIPQWKELPEQLVQKLGLDALLIERQGHGRSSPLTEQRGIDYLHRQAYEVLPGLLATLQVEQPILIGHSDGGTIALLYGARFRPMAIVSIAAHIFVEDITVRSIENKLSQRNFGLFMALLSKYHGDKTETLVRAWADTWTSPDFRSFNIKDEIARITAPILVIQSEDDEYGTELQVQGILDQVRSEVKRGRMLDAGGHMLHISMPYFLCDEIAVFLEECLNG